MTVRALRVGFVVFFLAGCTPHESASRAATAPESVAARTSIARPSRVAPLLELSGLIAPHQNVTLSNSLSEPVTSVLVEEGDPVSRGQVLATLDTSDLQANVDAAQRSAAEAAVKVSQTAYQGSLAISQGIASLHNAQDSLAAALAKLKLDRVNLDRYHDLLASGSIPRQQYDEQLQLVANDLTVARTANGTLRDARTTVGVNGSPTEGLQASTVAGSQEAAKSAQAQVEQAKAQLQKAAIRSPIDGVVVNRNVNPGEYPGSRSLFTIQDTQLVYAILNATTSQVFGVRPGDAAQISPTRSRVPALPGRVVAVLGQTTPGSTNFTVKVRVPNPDRVLQSGMVVTGSIGLRPVAGIGIATTAFTDDAHTHVAVLRNGTVSIVTVTELASGHGRSIVSGLRDGARIVTDGQLGLSDGQRVATRN